MPPLMPGDAGEIDGLGPARPGAGRAGPIWGRSGPRAPLSCPGGAAHRAPHRVGRGERQRTYTVRTFGCQMNEHDSERIAGLLEAEGMVAVDDPADADV